MSADTQLAGLADYSLTLDTGLLRAVALAAGGGQDTRDYLQDVEIRQHGEGILATATDGHILATALVGYSHPAQDLPGPFLLPGPSRTVVERGAKRPATTMWKASPKAWPTVEVRPPADDTWETGTHGPVTPVYGHLPAFPAVVNHQAMRYPLWPGALAWTRRDIGKRGLHQLDPKYMALLPRMMKLIGTETPPYRVDYDSQHFGGSLFRWPADGPHLIVFIAPLRGGDEETGRPYWVPEP